jgi:hypothetical protein
MAQGKKSFIAYADWKNIFDELPNEDAGQLIKHIFSYVNDENPTTESILIKAVFANIKSTLKRDLEKWDKQLKQRSDAGKASAESRKAKSNDRSTTVNETERNSTDSVNVNDNVIVKENNMVERRKKFATTLEPFLNIYGKELLNNFFLYWTEENKSKTKMRFELQKTWSPELRLKNWASRDKAFAGQPEAETKSVSTIKFG